MATLFTKIIEGEIPGRFVWRDDRAVVFLTIAPITPGHVLVVPIEEVDHWIDLDPELAAHLMRVAMEVGRAQMQVFTPRRIGMIIAGLEVPHCHLHLVQPCRPRSRCHGAGRRRRPPAGSPARPRPRRPGRRGRREPHLTASAGATRRAPPRRVS
jgi:diadenosine tetraphosphate (Ap4A) HIT family hydrolase